MSPAVALSPMLGSSHVGSTIAVATPQNCVESRMPFLSSSHRDVGGVGVDQSISDLAIQGQSPAVHAPVLGVQEDASADT